MSTPHDETEERSLKLLMDPLERCATYKPQFGTAGTKGVTLAQFKPLYGDDPFYRCVGLDEYSAFAS
jgi:hypothetical protein